MEGGVPAEALGKDGHGVVWVTDGGDYMGGFLILVTVTVGSRCLPEPG